MWTNDPLEGLFPTETEQPQAEEWYDTVVLGIDPTRGDLYDAAAHMVRDLVSDREDPYTYYGLPALAVAPDAYEE
jgi:hypothetical protein